ncbi:hypothetical protein HYU20_01060 [Candidatus Woesearchaeota archaeon]|nr:hypothetical protein [Candidatus Woesearchaeota archaeon]
MGIVEEAFSRLFPESGFDFTAAVTYSKKFKPYNATVRKIGSNLHFNLSRSWKGVSDEIVVGLIQHLLVKILRKESFFAAAAAAIMKENRGRITSLNMQLYDDFIKGVSEVAVANGVSDEKMESSFGRVNEKYFLGFVDKPQLRWGSGSFRKLASYDYHTNTITVSSLFRDAPERLLDYLVYHEMLHKKLKFSSGNGSRNIHHGSEFRKLEARFDSHSEIEDELNSFIRSRSHGIRQQHIRSRYRFNWRRLLLLR